MTPGKKKKEQRRDACSGPRRYGPTNCAEAQPWLVAQALELHRVAPGPESLEGVEGEPATLGGTKLSCTTEPIAKPSYFKEFADTRTTRINLLQGQLRDRSALRLWEHLGASGH